jgi:Tfp pilus assembly protein PilP
MTWKSYVIASGAGLLATYLVSTPPPTAPGRTPAVGQSTAAPQAAPTVDIQAEASRLQTRVREAVEYQEPSRNPFRYAARRRVASPDPEPDIPPEPDPTLHLLPEPPAITVAGIVTKTVDGVRRRTAILITAAGPLEVSEGDAVGAEYRVVRVEEDAVELTAGDGTRRRISLRP